MTPAEQNSGARQIAAIMRAADNLYTRLSEQSADALDEACADLWPGGEDEWWEQRMTPGEAEAHVESVFRAVLVSLASLCLDRAKGDGGAVVTVGGSGWRHEPGREGERKNAEDHRN